jgi:excisionase family DNA binding protein
VRKTSPKGGDDLTVAEAAAALGTSPQTVRKLLRDGELSGRRQDWGSRFVWVPSRKGVDEFLSQHGRLEGRVRRRPPVVAPRAPFLRGPRGRATVVVVVLGLPLLVAYVSAQILPVALWFDELGQLDTFRRIAAAKAELWLLTGGTVGVFMAANLVAAAARAGIPRTPAVGLGIGAAAVVAATFFASSVARHWQAFLLWRHGQPFGVTDPISGKDAGFFVFSLPFQLTASGGLLWLIGVTAAAVGVVYRARGALRLRPLRVSYEARVHLAALAAAFLLVVAWRFRLERYVLELGQPSTRDPDSFAGAGYVDVRVRSRGLAALSIIAIAAAFACVAAPRLARSGYGRAARLSVAVPAAALLVALVSVASWVPALVQRLVVDPNPVLSEGLFLERSIAATRGGLDLDDIETHPYSPSTLRPVDVWRARSRLANVAVWDTRVIEARMRDLVTRTPYYRPEAPTVDSVRIHRRPQLTIASTQELDLRRAGHRGGSWASDRLTYTHGLGLPRYSGTEITRHGQPRLLDAGLGIRQPRIYFGAFPARTPRWVLADTRRPEADIPAAGDYHYDGAGGIALSSWIERAMFALHLKSKELLLSDDITPDSRILLHRDVRDRLATLAPFIRWDSHPAPLAAGGRIVFVVDGYTTSENYPDAERVPLAGAPVSYARASVRATVDAFSGHVALYLTGEADPVARAWAQAFPALFRPPAEMPAQLRGRMRYPRDLFEAQSTAYERFHTTRPDVFASGSDVWSPPASVSGSLDVAGDIQFDEDDEDDLRHGVRPAYKLAPPPGRTRPRLVLSTLYSPRRGQNLVASLDGWVDGDGGPHLASRVLPRDPITLGPAQISRLVFATPRVSNLLGLTNLELRDLDKSSLDTVSLGRPSLVFLPRGIVQIQSLYKGASGPGVSRLVGVTAFLNGRAGVGSSVADAVRQALHEPPRISLERPSGPVVVGSRVELRFRVTNARREVMTITSPVGRQQARRSIEAGSGAVAWVPSAAGVARVHLSVDGMDGSTVTASAALRVLSRPPSIRFTKAPARAVVGRRVVLSFKAGDALDELAQISTREGTFSRQYLIRNGTGLIEWIPTRPGRAVVHVRARGRQGQTAEDTTLLTVARARRTPGPEVTLVRVPDGATVGRESEIAFRVTASRSVDARITGDDREVRVWRFTRPTGTTAFAWTPTRPGRYRLIVSAHSRGGTMTQTVTQLTAERPR